MESTGFVRIAHFGFGMRGLGLVFSLASSFALFTAPAAAAPAAQVEGFAVPPAQPVPGFEQVQTSEPAAKSAPAPGKSAPASAKPGDPAGRYAIFRAGGKDTGCMLTLENSKGKGGYKATLSPACGDQGIVIFDPVGWRVVKGSLVLTARKGHMTRLDLQGDGRWMKDAKDGKALILKKM